MTIEWFGIVNFQPARATVGEDENGRTFVGDLNPLFRTSEDLRSIPGLAPSK